MHTIYLHNTRRNGQTDVTEHRVWDGDLFLSRATDRARAAGSKSGDASRIARFAIHHASMNVCTRLDLLADHMAALQVASKLGA